MESDHRRRLATPLDSLSDWLILEAAVARAAAGSAVAVECQDASGERVVDRIQSTHSVDPSRPRSGPVVALVDDVPMSPPTRFFVVLVPRHVGTLIRHATWAHAHRSQPQHGPAPVTARECTASSIPGVAT